MANIHEKSQDDSVKPKTDADSEANVSVIQSDYKLRRELKNRHMAMISIGGVIGTGLFLGTASSLQSGGPVGLLLGYMVVGSICYCVMISVGEMAAYLPIPGGHITFAGRFVDQAWAFTLGWMYLYNWVIVLPAECSAAAVLLQYWNTPVSSAVWITIIIIVVVTINIFGAGVYGEAEFIFASIKVFTIVGLIVLGIVIDLGGGPTHDRIGFRYWKNPGPFAQYAGIDGAKGRFLAWWSVMTQAAFSFIGTEVVAIAGAEAKNPRRNIPKAIRRVYVRILIFYIGGVAIIGLLVPYTSNELNLHNGNAAASPFVIAIKTAGISGLPSVINACLLTSAWSAANSDIYCGSRALYSLAMQGSAPAMFKRVNRWGLPWVAVAACSSFSLLAYMDVHSGSGKVFGWFANMTAIAGLMNWFGISVIYLRFYAGLKAQGIERNTLPYKAMFQPFVAWYSGTLCLLICILSGWQVFLKGQWATDTFVTTYLPLALYPILFTIARVWKRSSFIKPEDMDFMSGLDEVLAASYDEPPPRNVVERVWTWLM